MKKSPKTYACGNRHKQGGGDEGPFSSARNSEAGSFELLGPLARELGRHYCVVSYQLRGENDCFALRRR